MSIPADRDLTRRPDLVAGPPDELDGEIARLGDDLAIGTSRRFARRETEAPSEVFEDPGGGLHVRTGRAHVVCRVDTRLQDHRDELEANGWAIDWSPAWAPHSGYVRRVGDPAEALEEALAGLESAPFVETLEPEWISARARRGR